MDKCFQQSFGRENEVNKGSLIKKKEVRSLLSGDHNKENVNNAYKTTTNKTTCESEKKEGRPRIVNPFECNLAEEISQFTFSPSVFTVSKKSNDSIAEQFVWSIDERAVMCPVDIDEENAPLELTPDPKHEAAIHSALEKFWRTNLTVAPSPSISPFQIIEGKRIKVKESSLIKQKLFLKKDAQTQTTATFPKEFDFECFLEAEFRYSEMEGNGLEMKKTDKYCNSQIKQQGSERDVIYLENYDEVGYSIAEDKSMRKGPGDDVVCLDVESEDDIPDFLKNVPVGRWKKRRSPSNSPAFSYISPDVSPIAFD